jgi:tungstate transport system substrate-binding protein
MKTSKSSCYRMILFMLLLFLGEGCLGMSQNASIRLAMVNVPDELVRPLLPDFQKQTGLSAEIVYTGSDPFAVAREGKADLVISHYGHEGVESFITGGYGEWPKAVFANQMVLLGPKSDPAHVRNLTDAVEAFRRIAESRSPFVTNNGAGAKYLENILWQSAKITPKGSWYLDLKSHGPQAVQDAAGKNAYVLWGLPPYLRLNRKSPLTIEPLVIQDPIFQRIMVSIVVNPKKVANTNSQGAKEFQDFLIAPETQARIRAFRYPDFKSQAWWPAGRHNSAQE